MIFFEDTTVRALAPYRAAFMVLAQLQMRADDSGTVRGRKMNRLAMDMRMSHNTFKSAMKRLSDMGYIERLHTGRRVDIRLVSPTVDV